MSGFLRKKLFSITVQGCRTNLYEADAILNSLEKRGAYHYEQRPDFAVVVSCSITASADRKFRKLVRRLRREHPDIVIVATGCCVQQFTDEQLDELGIDIAVGNRQKYLIPDLLEEYFACGGRPSAAYVDDIRTEDSWDALQLDAPRLHTRAFLKLQDGCDHFCSYCIVPFVRGRSVQRDFDDALEEAKRIVKAKCPEIVLTGVHLGLYERLPEFVRALGEIDGLKRIRFGSIEPLAVTDELLDVLVGTSAFCRHLHVPLQSGDDGVLKLMNRGYTAADFARAVERIRNKLGETVHVSTDFMLGFPGEDDAAFRRSLAFAEEMCFGKMHVFPYSPRGGTAAAERPRAGDAEVRQREEITLETAGRLHREYCSQWLNRPVEILVEEVKDGIMTGLTPEYVRVAAKAPEEVRKRDFVKVTTTEYSNGVLTDGSASWNGEED